MASASATISVTRLPSHVKLFAYIYGPPLELCAASSGTLGSKSTRSVVVGGVSVLPPYESSAGERPVAPNAFECNSGWTLLRGRPSRLIVVAESDRSACPGPREAFSFTRVLERNMRDQKDRMLNNL